MRIDEVAPPQYVSSPYESDVFRLGVLTMAVETLIEASECGELCFAV